jgi:hypothetical protein
MSQEHRSRTSSLVAMAWRSLIGTLAVVFYGGFINGDG